MAMPRKKPVTKAVFSATLWLLRREGSESHFDQPPGGLETHSLDFYMRYLSSQRFNTLRITFNHGACCLGPRMYVHAPCVQAHLEISTAHGTISRMQVCPPN